MNFVHLHNHTEYSLLDGAAKVGDLVTRAHELGMPAVSITDHGYMYGVIDFYRSAVKTGIKPVLGCEVYFNPKGRGKSDEKPELYHLLLLAKDNAGYRNLMAMVSEAAVGGFYYKPQVDIELLERYHEGIIGTSACMIGIVSRSIERDDYEGARRWARTYSQIFGEDNFYIELQNQGIVTDAGVTQDQLNEGLFELATELGLPTIGTNDIHYVRQEDALTQDMLLCIGTNSKLDDEKRMRFSCTEFYMKSRSEMEAGLGRYTEALDNTVALADRCNVELEFGKIILPVFETAPKTNEEHLRDACIEGLKERYGDPIPDNVIERLDYELSIINPKGIAPYFLIVQDFVSWAKENGIGVGPGRGSAAGSIVSYSLGITMLDPIENGLLFERFLNPERTEMPDIDIDFDDERRLEVIEYVKDKYGSEKVAQIITFGKMKARAAIKDAARVLGANYAVSEKISKQISEELNATIESSMAQSSELRFAYNSDDETRRIIDAAKKLEGFTRGEGVHAAGVVICRTSLDQYVPVKYDTKGGAVITQFDGPTVADLGLLKMDFLGLRTLTVLSKAVRSIEENHGVRVDLDEIPLDDPASFELMRSMDVAGVFQVESSGMRALLRDLKPTVFADIVAVLALYRPGPLKSGMVRDFIARKHGQVPVTYYDERLKPYLEETYGAIVYQEQVMHIAMEMCGFSAAKADKLRKAMGKKQLDVLTPLGEDWIKGAEANGYDVTMATKLWQDILPFAEYAFNKSHSAAYGVITMQTAYLKAHYPLEFMAAVLSSYSGKTEDIVRYISECTSSGIQVLPPDVNTSGRDFTPVAGEGIRFGLAAVRGIGEGVVDAIIAERERGGKFRSLHDFCARMDLTSMNKRAFDALIKAGAFDSTGYTRKHLMMMMEPTVDAELARQKERAKGQDALFPTIVESPKPIDVEWDRRAKLAFEKEMLGIYVSDHPLNGMRLAGATSLASELTDGQDSWFSGMIVSVKPFNTKKGDTMATFVLEDLEGQGECTVFAAAYAKYKDILREDSVVNVHARVEIGDRGTKLLVSEIELQGTVAPEGTVWVEIDAVDPEILDMLAKAAAAFPGRDLFNVRITGPEGVRIVKLPWTVEHTAAGLFEDLRSSFGSVSYSVA